MSEPSIDPRTYKNALGQFCSGVTVITVKTATIVHGMTATAFSSVSLEPPRILICVGNHTRMHRLMSTCDRFGVSILSARQASVAAHFAGNSAAQSVAFDDCVGTPVVPGALVQLVNRIEATYVEGDHTVYLGRVIACRTTKAPPLLYFAGGYRQLRDTQKPCEA